MTEALHSLLAWINAHPNDALWLLFAVTLTDSLFIIGAFIPAALPLFAIGALVALGSLELWPTLLIATAGALLGDCISFRSEEHTSELQSLMRISYAVFCLKTKNKVQI